eukprot:ANDGO_05688.mRNA.1 hypothetical protein
MGSGLRKSPLKQTDPSSPLEHHPSSHEDASCSTNPSAAANGDDDIDPAAARYLRQRRGGLLSYDTATFTTVDASTGQMVTMVRSSYAPSSMLGTSEENSTFDASSLIGGSNSAAAASFVADDPVMAYYLSLARSGEHNQMQDPQIDTRMMMSENMNVDVEMTDVDVDGSDAVYAMADHDDEMLYHPSEEDVIAEQQRLAAEEEADISSLEVPAGKHHIMHPKKSALKSTSAVACKHDALSDLPFAAVSLSSVGVAEGCTSASSSGSTRVHFNHTIIEEEYPANSPPVAVLYCSERQVRRLPSQDNLDIVDGIVDPVLENPSESIVIDGLPGDSCMGGPSSNSSTATCDLSDDETVSDGRPSSSESGVFPEFGYGVPMSAGGQGSRPRVRHVRSHSGKPPAAFGDVSQQQPNGADVHSAAVNGNQSHTFMSDLRQVIDVENASGLTPRDQSGNSPSFEHWAHLYKTAQGTQQP